MRAAGFFVVFELLQRGEGAQLEIAQIVGLRRRLGIVLRLDLGDGRDAAGGQIVDVPVAAAAKAQAASVGGELRKTMALRRTRDLAQRAVAQIAHENVAVAHERRARTGKIVDRAGTVARRHRCTVDDAVAARGEIDAMQVDDRGILAPGRVVHRASVGGPVGVLRRRADPARIGHDGFQGQRGRGGRRRIGLCRGGSEDERSSEQAEQTA